MSGHLIDPDFLALFKAEDNFRSTVSLLSQNAKRRRDVNQKLLKTREDRMLNTNPALIPLLKQRLFLLSGLWVLEYTRRKYLLFTFKQVDTQLRKIQRHIEMTRQP